MCSSDLTSDVVQERQGSHVHVSHVGASSFAAETVRHSPGQRRALLVPPCVSRSRTHSYGWLRSFNMAPDLVTQCTEQMRVIGVRRENAFKNIGAWHRRSSDIRRSTRDSSAIRSISTSVIQASVSMRSTRYSGSCYPRYTATRRERVAAQ